jgi:hypothetical protein
MISYYDTQQVTQDQIDYFLSLEKVTAKTLTQGITGLFYRTEYGVYEGAEGKKYARQCYLQDLTKLVIGLPQFAFDQAMAFYLENGTEGNKMPLVHNVAGMVKFYAKDVIRAMEAIENGEGDNNLPLPKGAKLIEAPESTITS